MAALADWSNRAGTFQGENLLWLMPGEPVRKSAAAAELQPAAQGQFIELCYTWAWEDAPQEGRLFFGQTDAGEVKAVWMDTWHMANDFMLLKGAADPAGAVRVLGAYPAPQGPDWGWRITLAPHGEDGFEIVMHNITPDGQEFLAVQAMFTRSALSPF